MSRLLTLIAVHRTAGFLLGIASALFLVASARAGEQPDLTKRIAPLIDGQTIAVAHARLDKVDVGRLVQLLGKVVELPAGEAAVAEVAGKLAITTLVNAGAKDVFVIVNLDGIPFEAFFVAIPVAGEDESKKIAAALKMGLNLRDEPEKVGTGELMLQPGKNFVLIASKNTLQRLRTSQPAMPPHLGKALSAFPQADARLAVVLPDTLHRSVGELMPKLPKELGGGRTAPLLDGFHSFSAGITLAPKFSTEASLRTDDSKTATAVRTLLVDLIGLAAKEIAKESGEDKMLPHLARLVALLTPSADKELLSWKLSEDDIIQAIRPLAAQIKASKGNAQAINNLKQIGLALHNYHDVHKQFPIGIRDKKGKLLLSWRVQILPYVGGEQLYEKFKLDEPWDSEHNIKLVKQMPPVFRSPGSKAAPGKTTFLGPTGKGLFFDRAAPQRGIKEITDGTSNTIMVLEVDDDHAATWSAPDDLNVDPKQPLKGIGGNPAGRFLALFADGLVRAMNRKIAPADFYKFLTIDAGDVTPSLR
jgi:hypothetical protein